MSCRGLAGEDEESGSVCAGIGINGTTGETEVSRDNLCVDVLGMGNVVKCTHFGFSETRKVIRFEDPGEDPRVEFGNGEPDTVTEWEEAKVPGIDAMEGGVVNRHFAQNRGPHLAAIVRSGKVLRDKAVDGVEVNARL